MAHAKVTMAMGLAVLMALSTIGAPVAAQEVVADPRQPSPENPHMHVYGCLLYTSPSPRDQRGSRMPASA